MFTSTVNTFSGFLPLPHKRWQSPPKVKSWNRHGHDKEMAPVQKQTQAADTKHA